MKISQVVFHAKKLLIDASHQEETRIVLLDNNKVEEFDFEAINKKQISGNIFLAKVTRVEPSLQAAFLDYGGNRHGFLAFSEIHPDYYQIPIEERNKVEERNNDEPKDDRPKRNAASRRVSRKKSPQNLAETRLQLGNPARRYVATGTRGNHDKI